MSDYGGGEGKLSIHFKNQKTTVVLSVSPQANFTSIKSQLLNVLQSTHPSGRFNGSTLPSEADNIILGIPVDPDDFQKGWKELRAPEGELDGVDGSTSTRIGGQNSNLDTPEGMGLGDGTFVAFKFRNQEDTVDGSDWQVDIPTMEDDYWGNPNREHHSDDEEMAV